MKQVDEKEFPYHFTYDYQGVFIKSDEFKRITKALGPSAWDNFDSGVWSYQRHKDGYGGFGPVIFLFRNEEDAIATRLRL